VVSEFTRCYSESIADDNNDGGSEEGLIIVDNISRTASPGTSLPLLVSMWFIFFPFALLSPTFCYGLY